MGSKVTVTDNFFHLVMYFNRTNATMVSDAYRKLKANSSLSFLLQ